MIARHWRGWTKATNADAYESFLRATVFPKLRGIPGYMGGYVLRTAEDDEVEFLVINLFESLDAVKAFAGAQYATPVIEPEARRLLRRTDATARHYDVRMDTT